MIEDGLKSVILHESLPEGYERIRIERGDQVGLFDRFMKAFARAYISHLANVYGAQPAYEGSSIEFFIKTFLNKVDDVTALEILVLEMELHGLGSQAVVNAVRFIGIGGYSIGFERGTGIEDCVMITFESVGMSSDYNEVFIPPLNPNLKRYILLLDIATQVLNE